MTGSTAQGDAAVGGRSPEIRDGHKLVVSLSANHCLQVDVVCPQDDARRCKWQDSKHIEAHGPCWLRYLVQDAGSEFLEWWTNGGPERVDLNAGPVEIEWWVDGGDEPEVWWRPVAQAAGDPAIHPDGWADVTTVHGVELTFFATQPPRGKAHLYHGGDHLSTLCKRPIPSDGSWRPADEGDSLCQTCLSVARS